MYIQTNDLQMWNCVIETSIHKQQLQSIRHVMCHKTLAVVNIYMHRWLIAWCTNLAINSQAHTIHNWFRKFKNSIQSCCEKIQFQHHWMPAISQQHTLICFSVTCHESSRTIVSNNTFTDAVHFCTKCRCFHLFMFINLKNHQIQAHWCCYNITYEIKLILQSITTVDIVEFITTVHYQNIYTLQALLITVFLYMQPNNKDVVVVEKSVQTHKT